MARSRTITASGILPDGTQSVNQGGVYFASTKSFGYDEDGTPYLIDFGSAGTGSIFVETKTFVKEQLLADTVLSFDAQNEYAYSCVGTITVTLPSPVDRNNRVAIMNNGSGLVTIASPLNTIENASTIVLQPAESVSLLPIAGIWEVV